MYNQHTLFEANDQIALIKAVTMTDVSLSKMKLYAGLAQDPDVRNFFEKRAGLMEKVNDQLHKELERVGAVK